ERDASRALSPRHARRRQRRHLVASMLEPVTLELHLLRSAPATPGLAPSATTSTCLSRTPRCSATPSPPSSRWPDPSPRLPSPIVPVRSEAPPGSLVLPRSAPGPTRTATRSVIEVVCPPTWLRRTTPLTEAPFASAATNPTHDCEEPLKP